MKVVFLQRTLLFYIGLAAVLGICFVAAYYVQSPYQKDCRIYTVSITLESETEAEVELYYDIGRGFHEVDHQEALVEPVREKITLQFTVPVWKEFTKLRLDPVGAGLKMKVYRVKIVSADGSFQHSVDLSAIQPGQQIINTQWDGDAYSFETAADANDPNLFVESFFDPQRSQTGRSLLVYAFWLGGGFLGMVFANWSFRFFILGL